jgi:hypothetical protein
MHIRNRPKKETPITPVEKEGSGQPALVYAAEVDLTSGKKEFTAKLIGHSSPDGSNGDLTKDTSSLTTALHIVKSITVYVQ